ncbi:MAG TPA: DUF4234 domain-containing protein [Candidatus Thermoplasmatota archaeon]|nr:DUF4234 domain-containing protein [Candidatus Thermoplasmatota archaeon]
MSFCPRCGAPTTASETFCTACGESLAPAILRPSAPPSGFPSPAMPQPASRPAGRVQDPMLVLLLTLVTLGIYGFFYWLRVSREVDAYIGKPGHSHKLMRNGYLIALVGGLVLVVGLVYFSVAAPDALDGATGANAAAQLGGLFLFIVAAAIAAGVGGIMTLVGRWRVWQAIEDAERAQNHPKPLSPIVQLLFTIIPYLNIVTSWIALYRNQKHLNGLWTGRTD